MQGNVFIYNFMMKYNQYSNERLFNANVFIYNFMMKYNLLDDEKFVIINLFTYNFNMKYNEGKGLEVSFESFYI